MIWQAVWAGFDYFQREAGYTFSRDRLRPGGLKQSFRMFWDATPGRHEIEDQIAEGDKVVTRLTAYGVHEGDLPGIPATGRQVKMTGTAIHRIENGKIAEKWSGKDTLGLLQQLGVLPMP
jgi:predicted ester cyclase